MSRKSLSPAERGLHTRRSQGEPKACLKLSFLGRFDGFTGVIFRLRIMQGVVSVVSV